jgi:hypothetical protein
LRDEETGEERVIVVGFKGLPVFGLEQTEGRPLPSGDPDIEKWVESLPLLAVLFFPGTAYRSGHKGEV